MIATINGAREARIPGYICTEIKLKPGDSITVREETQEEIDTEAKQKESEIYNAFMELRGAVGSVGEEIGIYDEESAQSFVDMIRHHSGW